MPAPSEMFSLTGKTAVVTGASSGLGVEFAKALAEAGANVVVAARREDRLAEVVDQISAAGGSAAAISCDVIDPESCDALMRGAAERFGSVDIVVANAGAVPEGSAQPESLPGEMFAQSVTINLVGTFNTIAAAGRVMLPKGSGSIIAISSVAGQGGHYNTPAGYSASKAGIDSLVQHTALRWGDRGVRVNAIAPGWFPSEMTERVLGIPIWTQRLEEQTAMRRIGEPHELLGALLLLSSDAGSYINGHILNVDGGMGASIGQAPYAEELWAIHGMAMPGIGDRIMPEAS